MKCEAGELGADERRAFERWLQACPQHAVAWQRLGHAGQRFAGIAGLTGEEALLSLSGAERRLRDKRRTLKMLATAASLGVGVAVTREYTGADRLGRHLLGQMLADLSTGAGEQKRLTLQDGSALLLNTRSALDYDFSARPQLVLRYGELALQSASELQLGMGRSLVTVGPGSDLTAYRVDGECRLLVVAGRVECVGGGRRHVLAAGEGLRQRGDVAERIAADRRELSWRQGMLTAQRSTLAEFVGQLARYRPGYLGHEESVASLTLSGAFPIADTELILTNLCRILPIRQQRLSRYWVRLIPA